MEKGDITRKEVEARLAISGDYVKMDYLQACLKKQMDFDTKKFVLTTLSRIYEGRKMYLEAGKMIRIAADINTTYEAKVNDFIKSAELCIRSGNYAEADISMSKAFASANEKQKSGIKQRIKTAYKTQAQDLLKKDKRKHAADTYEKILELPFLDITERKEIQTTLLQLYQKIGKIREFYNLQRNMNNQVTIQQKQSNVQESSRRDDFDINDLLR